MSTALVPTLPGRPVWLHQGGTWICVSIHDHAYLATRAELRRAIGAAGRHSRRALERAIATYRRFLRDEAAWYAALSLTPPARRGPTAPEPRASLCADGHPLGTDRGCQGCRIWRTREATKRYRRRCGRPPMAERLTCRHGHRRTADNTVFYRHTNGRTYRRCRLCWAARGKRHD